MTATSIESIIWPKRGLLDHTATEIPAPAPTPRSRYIPRWAAREVLNAAVFNFTVFSDWSKTAFIR